MNSHFQYILNSEGHYYTPARQLVFDIINAYPAVTMKELRRRVHGRIPDSSLYRALQVFRELEIIRDVVIGGQQMIELSGEFRPHHHHVSCKQCGASVDINDEKLEKYLEQLPQKHGYQHLSHSFEVIGLCKDCQARGILKV